MSAGILFRASNLALTDTANALIARLETKLQNDLIKRLAEANKLLESNSDVLAFGIERKRLEIRQAKYERIGNEVSANRDSVTNLQAKLNDLYSAVYNGDVASFEATIIGINDKLRQMNLVFDPLVAPALDQADLMNNGIGISDDAATFDDFTTQAGKDAANAAIAEAHARIEALDELFAMSQPSINSVLNSAKADIEQLDKIVEATRSSARSDMQKELQKFRRQQEMQIVAIATSLTNNPNLTALNMMVNTQPPKGSLLDLFS